jgi:hypothetical protein
MTSDRAIEIHSFYSQLLKSYSILSEDEIRDSMLNEEFKHKNISWESFGQHIQHLRAALASSDLNEDRKNVISIRLDRQKENYDEYLWQPEVRMIVGEGDRQALTARRLQLTNGYYYVDEKKAWQARQAEGFISDWTNIPKELVKEIDKKIQILDSRLSNSLHATSSSSFRQPTVPQALTSQQQESAFYIRWDEFRNVVNISFSTADDDAKIKVYNAANPPQESGGAGLWCPMITNSSAHESWLWLGFSQQKRDAIRLGFMQGICRIMSYFVADPVEWQERRAEFSSHLFKQYFNPITEQTHRTKQYAHGRERIEKLLRTIYDAGRDVPYHPNFDEAFLAHLEQLPLHEVDTFLLGFCEREGLRTPSGYAHLLNLVNNTLQEKGSSSQEKANHALTWLRTAAGLNSLSIADPTTSPNNSTSNALGRGTAQYSVADLYAFSAASRREDVAKKAKVIWDKLRSELPSPADEPATLAALFQLMDWLGMVREGVSATEWRAAFLREWGVNISVGIAKYQLKKPISGKFRQAVVLAYEAIKATCPPWVNGKDLPGIYR